VHERDEFTILYHSHPPIAAGSAGRGDPFLPCRVSVLIGDRNDRR
jgi:hypothetical protein